MKIALAYSGGLDTSVLVRWLKDHYNAEIVTFAADVGQEEELEGLEEKSKATGPPSTIPSISLKSLRQTLSTQ